MSNPTGTPFLIRMVTELPELVPLARIDRVWAFPPRLHGDAESGLLVLALLSEEEPGSNQREVVTVEYELRTGKGAPPPVREVTPRGWAPAERVPQLIAGVLRRLGGVEEEPLTDSIGGETERWSRFAERITAGMVDPVNGE